MRYRALLLLLIAIVLGALAAFMVNTVVTQQVSQQDIVVPEAGRPAVVAVTDLAVGLNLEPLHLRLVELPDNAYPAQSFQSIDDVLSGEQPVVVSGIVAGEVVLPTKLSTGVLLRGLTTRIPEGFRAVSIPVNEVRGVGGFVLPSDRVDVLHTTNIGRRDDRPVTRTLLQNMIVLGVDQVSSESAEDPVVVNVVTLLADPTEAKTLTLAQQVGDLTLMLRNEGDRDDDESATVSLDDLWEYGPEDQQPRQVISAAPRAAVSSSASASSRNSQEGVQIIRGLDINQETVGPDGAIDAVDLN